MSGPSTSAPGPDPEALEAILFACLEVEPAGQEAAVAAACRDHPALAEALTRCWFRVRGLQASVGVPSRIAGHRILRRLGGGGMGVVYLAEQERPKRLVALKLIRSDLLESPSARERFRREAQAASSIVHPGLCPVFEVGEADGVPYMVMPYLEGITLATRIAELAAARGHSAPTASSVSRDLVSLVAVVARAVHHAHEHGLVHRDIKPGNIMLLTDGRPMLLDFGLARDISRDELTLTRTGERVGTPAYMAPEQLRGDAGAIDRRADVYALGLVLYEVALLERPFGGGDVLALRENIASGIRPVSLRRRVPFDLASIVLKASDPDPRRRYATAAEFADDLERFLQLVPVTARRLGPVARVVRWARRHPLVSGLLFALAVALGFAGGALRSSLRLQRSFLGLALQGESRAAERTDAGLAVTKALEADDADPTPRSLVQLNRAVAAQRELRRWTLGAPIRWVGFAADRQVAAITQDGLLYVLDPAASSPPTPLRPPGEGSRVQFTAASADRSVIVFVGAEAGAFAWWPLRRECKPLAGAHRVAVVGAAVATDGSIFTGDRDGNLAHWDSDGLLVGAFPWCKVGGGVLELALAGDRLLVGRGQGLALVALADRSIVDVPTEAPATVLSSSTAKARVFSGRLGIHGLFDLDGKRSDLPGPLLRYFDGHLEQSGRWLAIAHRGSVRVYDLDRADTGVQGVELGSYRDAVVGDGPVGLVRFSDDGSRLFAMAEDNVLQMFDAEGEPLLSLPGFARPARAIAYESATQLLGTGDEAGTVRLWDVRTCRASPPEFQVPRGVFNGFATGSSDPLITRRDNGHLALFPRDGSPPRDLEAGNFLMTDARVRSDGRLLAVAMRAGEGRPEDAAKGAAVASVWDVSSGERLFATPASLASPPVGVDFLAGDRLLVVTGVNARRPERLPSEIQVWRHAEGQDAPEARISCQEQGQLIHAAATPDGTSVVAAAVGGRLWRFPLELGSAPPTIGVPSSIEVGVAVSLIDIARQGDAVVAVCADDSARVFSLDGRLRWHLQGHGKRVERARFSPSGRWVVTASQDGSARIWDMATGKPWMEAEVGAPSPVWDAMFDLDERVLFTVSLDGVVRGWMLDREVLRSLSQGWRPR